jgi:hypothetical protein
MSRSDREVVAKGAADLRQGTSLAHVSQLIGEREQPQAIADQDVMLSHDDCSPFVLGRNSRSLSSRPTKLYSSINPSVATTRG